MKILKFKVVLFVLVLIPNIFFGNSKKNVGEKIVKLIINKDKNIIKYFDNTVIISEKFANTSLKKFNNYNGFNNENGLLYAIFFNLNKVDKKWKKLLIDSNYCQLSEVFKKSKKIEVSLIDKPYVIVSAYKNKVYTIYLRKYSDSIYKIIEITYYSTANDDNW